MEQAVTKNNRLEPSEKLEKRNVNWNLVLRCASYLKTKTLKTEIPQLPPSAVIYYDIHGHIYLLCLHRYYFLKGEFLKKFEIQKNVFINFLNNLISMALFSNINCIIKLLLHGADWNMGGIFSHISNIFPTFSYFVTYFPSL